MFQHLSMETYVSFYKADILGPCSSELFTCDSTFYGDIKHAVLCLAVRALHGSGTGSEEHNERGVVQGWRPHVVVCQTPVHATVYLTYGVYVQVGALKMCHVKARYYDGSTYWLIC